MTDPEEAKDFILGLKQAVEEDDELNEAFGFGHSPSLKVPGRTEIDISNQLVFDILEVLFEHDRNAAVGLMTVLISEDTPFSSMHGGVIRPSPQRHAHKMVFGEEEDDEQDNQRD